ncbi:MAG: type III-B CRISPR module RAMP protein Cmr4 [Ruminococcus sp.]|nr:type III-B CRISPR module RAMP protein Cmr4 [Ruminococcus sp.]
MGIFAYKIKCLTNLHVGSGDLNYNIIDNEVERDPVTGYPVIHASGLKGALREHFSGKMDNDDIRDVFGQEPGEVIIKAGSYKFLDARLLARPMRTSGQAGSVMVVSEKSVNDFIRFMNGFGITEFGTNFLSVDFSDCSFLGCKKGMKIEAENTGTLNENAKALLSKISKLFGEEYADNYAVVKDFNDYDLPVVARNKLDNGISVNLWYEEVVPHDSIFYTVIIPPDDEMLLKLDNEDYIQIGGHASIGCGITEFEKLN